MPQQRGWPAGGAPHCPRHARLSRAQRPSARRASSVCRIASAARMTSWRAASCTRIVSSSRRVWLSASRKFCLSWPLRFPHGHRVPARPRCVVPSSRFARAERRRFLLTPKLDHWPLWRPPRPWRALPATLEPASGARRPGLARCRSISPEFQLDQLGPRPSASLLDRHRPSPRLAPPIRSPPPTGRARSRWHLPEHLWGAIRPAGLPLMATTGQQAAAHDQYARIPRRRIGCRKGRSTTDGVPGRSAGGRLTAGQEHVASRRPSSSGELSVVSQFE